MDYCINVLQTIGEDFFYSSEDKEVFEVIDDNINARKPINLQLMG